MGIGMVILMHLHLKCFLGLFELSDINMYYHLAKALSL